MVGQDSSDFFFLEPEINNSQGQIPCEGAQDQTPQLNRQQFVYPVMSATEKIINDSAAYPFSRPVILSSTFHQPKMICEHARAQGKPYAFILLKTHHCDSRAKVCATSLSAAAHKANSFVQQNFSLYQTRFYDSTMYGRQVDIPDFQKIATAWGKTDRNPEMVIMDTATCQVVLRDKFYSSKRGGTKLFSQTSMVTRIDAIMSIMNNTPQMQQSFRQKGINFNYQQEMNNIAHNIRNNPNWLRSNNMVDYDDLLIEETSKQHRVRLRNLGIQIPNVPTTKHLDPGLNGLFRKR